MGREIVYCWKCATRLGGDDFERGKAFRHGDKVSCSECVFDLVADLSAEEQEAVLHPEKAGGGKPSSGKMKAVASERTERTGTQIRRTGSVPKTRTGMTGKIPITPAAGTRSISKKITRPIPKVEPPPEGEEDAGTEGGDDAAAKKKKKILLIAGGGGGLLVVVIVILIVALSGGGGKKSPVEDSLDPGGRPKTAVKKTDPKLDSPKEKDANRIVTAAQKLKTDSPNDLAGQYKIWQDAIELCKGTSLEGTPEKEIEAIKEKVDKEIAEVQKQCDKLMENEEFKKVFELWEAHKAKYDLEASTKAAETKLAQYKGIMDDRYKSAKKEVLAAVEEENAQKKLDVIKRISTWGFPDKVAELDNLKPGGETAPDPATPANVDSKLPVARAMSAEMKAFMPAWQAAVLPAYGRDYAAAIDGLLKAAKDSDNAEVKKAAAADAEDLRRAAKILEEGKKLAGSVKTLENITLEYQAAPSDWKKITGKVVKVDALRIELSTDLKDKPRVFIELSDLSVASLGEFFLTRGQKGADDARVVAILCCLEGNVEGAKKLAGASLSRVPDRFWQFAPEIKEKAPKPSSREFEARDLYLKAEIEWRDLKTRSAAFDKYKLLLGDYAATEYARRVQGVINGRMETGKEYVFAPGDLKTPGAVNTFKPTNSYKPKVELALVTSKALEDFNSCAENYVQVEFYALPNATYRCWALIGGCCAETMTFYYQTTEGKIRDGGKEKSIEPGGRAIDTLIPPLVSLPKEHAKHKPKDPKAPHPKEPTRWDWVEIRLPKPYAAPGAKEIRIFTDQPGFGIAYVIVSSTRSTMPDAKVKAALDQEFAGGGTAPTIKSSPDPTEWLLIGPFAEALATSQGPENEIDLGKSYPGKKDKVEWKKVQATWKSPTALLELDKNGVVAPKDNVAVYALIYVKSPSAQDAQLWLGHDEGCRVWLGNQQIHSLDKLSTLKGDEHKVKIQLALGWNRFLFKVNNKTGPFGLAVRWVDASGKPLEGLEFSTEADLIEKK